MASWEGQLSATPQEPTDDELITRALEIRADIEAMNEKAAADLEPYEMGLEAIENALLARMVARQSKSIGTVHGTAYVSPQLRLKLADRPKWLEWLLADTSRVAAFVTNHVSKEAIKTYMEANAIERNGQTFDGPPPPGVEATTFVQCNIRKA
jgi:hypothetical protein